MLLANFGIQAYLFVHSRPNPRVHQLAGDAARRSGTWCLHRCSPLEAAGLQRVSFALDRAKNVFV